MAFDLNLKLTSGPGVHSLSVLLLVEDDEAERYIWRRVVSKLGHEIVVVANGEGALTVLEADRGIKALITDIKLGSGMNGTELAAKARSLKPDIRLLFISGYSSDDLPPLPAPLLSKPYTESALVQAIQRLVAKS